MKRYAALSLAAVLLAGCGGGGGGSGSVPGTSPSKPQSKTVTGSVVISIPSGAAQSSSKARYPQFVSPNASSVELSVNGGADTSFDVSATSSLCVTTPGAGRNCTLTFGAPVGADAFAFLIFAGPNGSGTQLASAGVTQQIAAGAAFNFTVAMNAAIGTIVANVPTTNGGQSCPDQISTFNGISEGCAGNSGTVTITAYDPSGAQITGTAPFATPITIGTNDPAVTASPSQVTAPGGTTVLSYTGAALGTTITNALIVTLTVGTQVIPTSVPVRRSYLYVANSNAPAGTTPPGGGNIAVYTFGASLGATPVRVIAGANAQLSNPQGPLLDAAGNLYVLDNGPFTSNSNPVINVYAPGVTGNVAPIHQITAITAVDSNRACESMIFDPTGQYLLVVCDDVLIHVLSIPVAPTATAASLQTAELGSDFFSLPVSEAFDAAGNLYVTDPANNSGEGSIDYFPGPISPTVTNLSMSPTKEMGPGTSWPAIAGLAPVGIRIDNSGTLFSSIVYFNSTPGAPDADNEIGMWNTTTIPCTACAPTSSLTGTPFTTHVPAGIALDPAGNLYVSNPFANQITVFGRATVSVPGTTNNPPVLHTINTGANPGAPVGMSIGP